jgi:hypothetical protein
MAIKSRQGGGRAPAIACIIANKVSAHEEARKGFGLYRTCSEKGVRLVKDNKSNIAYSLFRSLECDSIYRHRRQGFIFAAIQRREPFRFDFAACAFN